MRRSLKQLAGCAAATAMAVGLFASQASAHVTLTSYEPVVQGSFAKIGISVPNERPDAGTVKLAVQMPEDQPMAFVSVQPKPGWDVATTTRKLDPPVEGEGTTISEVVDTITWTATGENQIAPGQFDMFWISVGAVPSDATELVFPAIQTYSSGEEVAWIQPVPASGEEPEHPAPTVAVVPATDAGTGTRAAASDDSDSNALAIVALVIGALGLIVGATGIVLARKARQSGPASLTATPTTRSGGS
jgi:uncharacterized protein YcnI